MSHSNKNNCGKIRLLLILWTFCVFLLIGLYQSWNNVVNASGHVHTYGNYTYVNSSYHQRKCTSCSYIAKSSHSYQKSYTKDPNCTDYGYDVYKCSKCKDTEFKNKVEKLGHNWKDATCTKPKTCSRCDLTSGSANRTSKTLWSINRNSSYCKMLYLFKNI